MNTTFIHMCINTPNTCVRSPYWKVSLHFHFKYIFSKVSLSEQQHMLILLAIFWLTVIWFAYFYFAYRPRSVKGETILITGGGSGIGRNMAKRFSKMGAKIVLWDMNQDGLDKVKKEIEAAGGECKTFKVDVTDRNKVYNTAKLCGDVDVLINNAGIVTGKKLMDSPDELLIKTMEVNTISHFWTAKAFLPGMMERKRGQLVTISSLAGVTGNPGMVDYCASKFGAYGLHESIALELEKAGHNIKTTLVCPYFINTGMFDGVQSPRIPILTEEYASGRIVKAIVRGEEVLVMPWWLCFSPIMRALPVPWMRFVYKLTGAANSMNDFKGRK